ncbi:hypothetical protein HF329_00665 [Chitinophaga oryzae]|uniref:Uncharacterized protein n=1 Tax=Chitinophaga oryzae TaxID=2725414 RepID=A0AAE7D582_9BACT|nr:hypothetical protein [Chitinophaga oryzae]QJB29895.1 hypothetical protein HF329_00665 [Chitinophaga oryzae]
MELRLDIEDSNKSIKVEFVPELAVQANDVYLLSYEYDAFRYICFNGDEPDIRVDEHSQYKFSLIKHIIYGHFIYESQKISGQVGAYLSSSKFGAFDHVLLSHDYCGVGFRSQIIGYMPGHSKYILVDLDDFNKTKKLINQESYTLYDYLEKKLSPMRVEDLGLSFEDETTLFSPISDRFDKSNIWSIKGMSMYIEELIKKAHSKD